MNTTMTRFLAAIVFFFVSIAASGQTPNYASYNWQRGQTFQDTTRFNDTIFTANDGNSTQWDSAYTQVQNGFLRLSGGDSISGQFYIANGATNVFNVYRNFGNTVPPNSQHNIAFYGNDNQIDATFGTNTVGLGLIQQSSGSNIQLSTTSGTVTINGFRIWQSNDFNQTDIDNWDSVYSQVQNNYLNWDGAYNDKINSASFNTGDGVLTLTQQDAGTVTADLDGRYLTSYTETDPIFTASTAFGISDADTTNWDSAYTAANQAVTTLQDFNPNSQPIADQFFSRARDSVASTSGYVEYYNQVNSDIARLMNLELSSGRTAYQDATIVFSPAAAYTSATPVIQPYDGSADFTFARSSTATRVDSKGDIETGIAANLARYDFTEDSQEPALLLEPARTNLLLRSQEFDNASWVKTLTGTGVAPVVTANAGIAPDGTTTADRIQFDAGAGGTSSDISILRQINALASGDAANTIYVKSNTGTTQYINHLTAGNTTEIAVGTEWQRLDQVVSLPSVGTAYGLTLAGDNTETTADILVWGAQLEAGSYPTSYIPTTTATVTRAAETLSKTGIADLLGDSEGTLYFEASTFTTSDFNIISLSDNSTNNVVFLGTNSSGGFRARVVVGGVVQGTIDGGTNTANSLFKVALKYSLNDVELFVNGVSIGTLGSSSVFADGTLTHLFFSNAIAGNNPFYGNVKALALWDTALTDTELAALTTP